MRSSVKTNINRSFIGRSSRNLEILMFQNSYFHFYFRLEFIFHLKETLSGLCVSGINRNYSAILATLQITGKREWPSSYDCAWNVV
jgi:hypothetical protein